MIKYALLGIIQGLTEFFPVSSKGHLVLLQHAFGMRGEEIVLPVVLHAGTLLAVIVFLRREILKLFSDRKLLYLVLVSTVITGAVGVAGKDLFKALFLDPAVVAPGMIFTGLVLLLSGRNSVRNVREDLGFRDAFFAGLAQAVALIPGVSRSGMTISSLLSRKIDGRLCFIYSFLISVPAVLGASLFELKDIRAAVDVDVANLAAGFVCSLVAGLAALSLLKKLLVKEKFHYFGYYCLAVGLLLGWLAFRA